MCVCVCVQMLWQVYKAVLPDSRVVAVKKLVGRGKQSEREFRAEIETVGKVNHPHLVQLLGYCRTKEGKLLVYEYFENGSLNKFMRRNAGGKETNLAWETRLKIALGAAEGLAYLHNCEPRIIHRDVKASNILLDKNFEAKVSDFGLARLIERSKTHVTTFIAGTKAYIAPEYQKSLRLTIKCDVYSYGVVLLELLTGKDPSLGRNFDLITWVKRRMSSCYEFFDVRMLDSGDKEAMTTVLNLALQCTNASPNLRPSMDEVVAILRSIQKVIQVPVVDIVEEGGESSESSVQGDDQEEIASLCKQETTTDTLSSSIISSSPVSTNDDLFLSKGPQDTTFVRPCLPRVVSTPLLSEAAKELQDTRDIVTIEDIRTESDQLTLGLEASDPKFTPGADGFPSKGSSNSFSDQYSRCQSFG